MSTLKIIHSNEVLSTLDIKSKNARIDKKYHDDALQVSVMHLSTDRILYIEPVTSEAIYKTYYIVKGACFVFDDASIIREGDMLIFNNPDEIQTLKVLEDTIILVHATNYDVYKTVEIKHELMDRLLTDIQNKDHYTGEHSLRVYELVQKLAIRMGYKAKALNDITKAAYYHDLGKIHIADHILNKPDKLNSEEYDKIKKHVETSKDEIIKHFNTRVFDIIYQHHERFDGSGYPVGLKGYDILEEARILAVCDSYDAMITDRVYKKGKSAEIALLELRELSGILYDPEIVAAFTNMILE